MDALVKAAQNSWKTLIDLQDHHIRALRDSSGNAAGAGEIEIAVFVHRSYGNHDHIHRQKAPVVGHHVPEQHGDKIAGSLSQSFRS